MKRVCSIKGLMGSRESESHSFHEFFSIKEAIF